MGHVKNMLFEALNSLVQLSVVHACVVRSDKLCEGRNCLPFNRLFAVESHAGDAGGWIRTDEGQPLQLKPGCVYLMPADIPLTYRFEQSLVMVGFHFRLELEPGLDLLRDCQDCQSMDGQQLAIRQLIHDLEQFHEGSQLIAVNAKLMQLIGPFVSGPIDEWQRLSVRLDRYRRLFALLDEMPSPHTTVAELAGHMGMAPDTLTRRFRRDFGQGLKFYMSRRTVRKATELLLFSDLHVKEVAYRLGFSNEFYFSRFIKNHTGLSPTALRQMPAADVV